MLKSTLFQLNFFERDQNDERYIKTQRFATRLYLFILVISIDVLCFYTLLNKEIYRGTSRNPTEAEFRSLKKLYPESLSCPCSDISVPYSNFLTLDANYHPVCTSDLVSQAWIDYNTDDASFPFYHYLEYRRNAAFQFQLLATLCKRARQTGDDALTVFFRTNFVGSEVVPQDRFESQINSLIEAWKSNTVGGFLRAMQLIRTTNQGNQFINSFFNTEFIINETTGLVNLKPREYDSCSCRTSQFCRTEMNIYVYDGSTGSGVSDFTVQNFFCGCSPLESLLASTLECFYRQDCMNTLIARIGRSASSVFTPLDANMTFPYDTIEKLLNKIMVHSWSQNISFTSYYQKCSPHSCTYTFSRSITTLSLITTLMEIVGGLTLILKILFLIVLRTVERILEKGWRLALIELIRSMGVCNQEHQVIERLQFALLSMVLLAASVILSSSSYTETVQVMSPSRSTYENLPRRFSASLYCPCSKISIQYKSFLTITPRLHQICHSDFMREDSSDFVYSGSDRNSSDFLVTAAGQLSLIQLFCKFSTGTVNSELSQLAITDWVGTQLLSTNLFGRQVQKTIHDARMRAPIEVLGTLALIRETMGSNMIMSTFSTNWRFQDKPIDRLEGLLHTAPIAYDECNCGYSSRCVRPSRGMLAGCYPLEALLQSTLECFYGPSCIYLSTVFPPLDSESLPRSRFDMNESMESIVSQLMVEDYEIRLSYDLYFAQCKPTSCSYSFVRSQRALEIVTVLISLYSGIAIISGCVVLHSIKLRHHRQRNRVHLITNTNTLDTIGHQ